MTGGFVMPRDAAELSRRLARDAEAVCRHYLSSGRRQGRYWTVGDVRNAPGRSMFVRLQDSSKGPAGKWQDAATGEHGDLLDVIRALIRLADPSGEYGHHHGTKIAEMGGFDRFTEWCPVPPQTGAERRAADEALTALRDRLGRTGEESGDE